MVSDTRIVDRRDRLDLNENGFVLYKNNVDKVEKLMGFGLFSLVVLVILSAIGQYMDKDGIWLLVVIGVMLVIGKWVKTSLKIDNRKLIMAVDDETIMYFDRNGFIMIPVNGVRRLEVCEIDMGVIKGGYEEYRSMTICFKKNTFGLVAGGKYGYLNCDGISWIRYGVSIEGLNVSKSNFDKIVKVIGNKIGN